MSQVKQWARRVASAVPGAMPLYGKVKSVVRPTKPENLWPAGHYYSPIPNRKTVREKADRLFRSNVPASAIAGVDLRHDAQVKLLHELGPLLTDFPFPDKQQIDGFRFYMDNPFFAASDPIVLHAMLRHFKPRRVVEVGSGFSSAVMLDTNDRYLEGRTEFTFIEPFADRLKSLLREQDRARTTIIEKEVQDVPLSAFEPLEAGDFLFIDSSHVSKVGSDLNHLLFEVVPRVKPGVFIHFHDIFWPFEYPLRWIDQGYFWNEDYLLRAFLQFNHEFEIVLFVQYLADQAPDAFGPYLGKYASNPGQSLWLRRRGG